jgi:hypothetical protein
VDSDTPDFVPGRAVVDYGTAQANARQYLYTDAKQPRDWRRL